MKVTFEDIITSLGFMIEIGKYMANSDYEYMVGLGMLNKRIYNVFKSNNVYIQNISYGKIINEKTLYESFTNNFDKIVDILRKDNDSLLYYDGMRVLKNNYKMKLDNYKNNDNIYKYVNNNFGIDKNILLNMIISDGLLGFTIGKKVNIKIVKQIEDDI